MLISDRGPTTDQRTNTTQDQLGEFCGVIYYEYGRRLRYRGRKAVSLKPTPAWVATPKACSELTRLEIDPSRSLSWFQPLPGS